MRDLTPRRGGPSTNLRSMRADALTGSESDPQACQHRKLNSQQRPAIRGFPEFLSVHLDTVVKVSRPREVTDDRLPQLRRR